MSAHMTAEELLIQAEKLLREADALMDNAKKGELVRARNFRNAINAACNALHKATRA